MNSYMTLKLIVGCAFGIISMIVFFGGMKENRESFKKLNEHLDEKEKAQSPQVSASEKQHVGAH
jgi:Na+/melibiose symporter-like transporter